jgi:hypothetical protein
MYFDKNIVTKVDEEFSDTFGSKIVLYIFALDASSFSHRKRSFHDIPSQCRIKNKFMQSFAARGKYQS